MSYDIQSLKRIPIASILKMYGIAVFKRSDTESVCDCPLRSHTESSKEHKRTFAFGLNKNGDEKWLCHSTNCQKIGNHHGGDGIDLTARLYNLTPKDAMKKLGDMFAIAQNGHPPSKPSEVSNGNKPLAFELKGIIHEHPMMQGRGISAETAKEFGVGFFPGKGSMANRVVFPLMEQAQLTEK